MPVKLDEVFIFNSALDGKDIPFFSSFSTLNMSRLLAEEVMDSLIAMGYLETREEFTLDGARLAKMILDYKEAERYIQIDNLVIGVKEDGSCILLEKNIFEEDYLFSRVELTDGIDQLLGTYEFLQGAYTVEPAEGIEFEQDKLFESFDIKAVECLQMVTANAFGGKKTDEIIFTTKGKLYLYDCKGEMLYSKTSAEIKEVLNERLAV